MYMEYFDEIIQMYRILYFGFWVICSVLAKVLLWNILIQFYAVKNTKDKGHYSGHLSSYLTLIYLMNIFPVDFTE